MNKVINCFSFYRNEFFAGWIVLSILLTIFVHSTFSLFLILGVVLWATGRKEEERTTHQLAGLINSGVPLPEALERLGVYQPFMKKKLDRAAEALRNGASFHEVCTKNRRLFSRRFARLVEQGERHNDLPELTKIFMDYFERERITRTRTWQALNYPLFVLIFLLFAVSFLMVFVIPMFATMYSGSGVELPGPTALVMKISEPLSGLGGWLVVLMVFLLLESVFTQRFFKFPTFKKLDALLLARFTRRFLQKGVGLGDALTGSAGICGYRDYQKACLSISEKSQNGSALMEALQEKLALPEEFKIALAQGSLIGDIPHALELLIDRLQDYFDTRIQIIFRRMESALILVVAVCTFILLLGAYLPIFKLGETVIGTL